MAWLAVLLIVFTHATSDAINITRDFVATTEPTEPTQCCIDDNGKLGARKILLGCDPGSHKIHFSSAFGTHCSTEKWDEAKEKAVKAVEAVDGLAVAVKAVKAVDWFAKNHHKYVHKGTDVVLAGMVKAVQGDPTWKQEELDATSSSTRLSCCVNDDGVLSERKPSLLGFGPACDPKSHKIHFSQAFGTSCSNEAWDAAKEDTVEDLDEDLRTLVDRFFLMNHHTYVHEGADVVLANMVVEFKLIRQVRNKKDKKSALRVAKRICGVTFEFDADSQDVQTGLAKTHLRSSYDSAKVKAEAKARLMKLPGCELSLACTPAFRADDMFNGKKDIKDPNGWYVEPQMWALDCEKLAYHHTQCFEQVKKLLREKTMEWWFQLAYPNKVGNEGNEQAREMFEKIGKLKARAAAFADKTLATTQDGKCVGRVPFYKTYSIYGDKDTMKELPGDVGSALTGVNVGNEKDDNEERLRRYMYEGNVNEDDNSS